MGPWCGRRRHGSLFPDESHKAMLTSWDKTDRNYKMQESCEDKTIHVRKRVDRTLNHAN